MLIDTLRQLFARDLNRLILELEAYRDEKRLWHVERGITNSAGNLSLHLIGNLTTYISATLGGVAYKRDRDREFSLKSMPRAELIRQIETTRDEVEQALRGISESALQAEYPLLVFDAPTSTEYFLMHLATHLAYHLGQVNYHRRLLDAPAES